MCAKQLVVKYQSWNFRLSILKFEMGKLLSLCQLLKYQTDAYQERLREMAR